MSGLDEMVYEKPKGGATSQASFRFAGTISPHRPVNRPVEEPDDQSAPHGANEIVCRVCRNVVTGDRCDQCGTVAGQETREA